jgi:hypothetical protein
MRGGTALVETLGERVATTITQALETALGGSPL